MLDLVNVDVHATFGLILINIEDNVLKKLNSVINQGHNSVKIL